MAQEFPSIINASGLIDDQGVNNERGATTTLNGTVYTITLERAIAIGWAVCAITPRGPAPIATPIILQNEHVTDLTFQVEWYPGGLGVAAAQNFFYTIWSTDENQ